MLLLANRVKISNITSETRDIVLNFLGKGEVIGEIAVLNGSPRTVSVFALEEAESPPRATSSIIEENTLPMAARAAAGVVRLADQHGRMVEEGTLIDLNLGRSRDKISCQLGLFRDLGVLRIDGDCPRSGCPEQVL
jgi:hypothetical protein